MGIITVPFTARDFAYASFCTPGNLALAEGGEAEEAVRGPASWGGVRLCSTVAVDNMLVVKNAEHRVTTTGLSYAHMHA